MNFFKRLFHRHDYSRFVRNIYGDEINYTDARSVWQCRTCGKYQYRQELNASRDALLKDLIIVTQGMPPKLAMDIIIQAGFNKDDIKNMDL